MAQRIDALKFRLGNNSLWLSQWYSKKKNFANLFFEDHLIRTYLINVFDLRGFLCKRCLIKRQFNKVFIFIEFYSNSYIPYQVPRYHRKKKKLFHKVLKFKDVLLFLKRLCKNKIYISFQNIFIVNRIHRKYVRRLRGLFSKFKRYKFTLNILTVFNITIRNRSTFFLSKIMSQELTMVNFRKRDVKIWKFVSFCSKLVKFIKNQNSSLHGIRIHLKGRFKGIKRSRLNRYFEGTVPFNTMKAKVDYSRSQSITVNGSFGVHIWGCYTS
jgi:hypothetical protein